MTRIAVSVASTKLDDLILRAEAGEEVLLTREGRDVARIHPIPTTKTSEERARVIQQAHSALQGILFDETCAARSQDFLYDEDGLPA